MNLYVGNINFDATADDIQALFEQVGDVESVKIMLDKETGKSKGFAFVEMPDTEEAIIALKTLNGRMFFDRNIVVNQGTQGEDNKDKKVFRQGGGGFDKKPYSSGGNRDGRPQSRPYSNDRPRSFDNNDRPRTFDKDRKPFNSDRPRTYDNDRPRSYDNDRPRTYNEEVPPRTRSFDDIDRPKKVEDNEAPKRARIMRPRLSKNDKEGEKDE